MKLQAVEEGISYYFATVLLFSVAITEQKQGRTQKLNLPLRDRRVLPSCTPLISWKLSAETKRLVQLAVFAHVCQLLSFWHSLEILQKKSVSYSSSNPPVFSCLGFGSVSVRSPWQQMSQPLWRRLTSCECKYHRPHGRLNQHGEIPP